MPLARPLGDFDAPRSQLPLWLTSIPKRYMMVLLFIYCGNSYSIHTPVEDEDKKERFNAFVHKECSVTHRSSKVLADNTWLKDPVFADLLERSAQD